MPSNFWAFFGAFLIVGALGMVYSWKVEADKAAELEAQIQRLEQRKLADDAAMAQREAERKEAARKAQEQRDEIKRAFEGLSDDELLCRLHGLCAKGAGARGADGSAGKPAGGVSETSNSGGHD